MILTHICATNKIRSRIRSRSKEPSPLSIEIEIERVPVLFLSFVPSFQYMPLRDARCRDIFAADPPWPLVTEARSLPPDPLEKHCFWGEHRPLQQSLVDSQVPPFMAQERESSSGSVGVDDGLVDGSREGSDSGAPEIGGVEVDDGPVDGRREESDSSDTKIGGVDVDDGPVDGSREGFNSTGIDVGVAADGASENEVRLSPTSTSGEELEGTSSPTSWRRSAYTSAVLVAPGTVKRKDSVVPAPIFPLAISKGGSETTMAISVWDPLTLSSISDPSTTSIS